MTNIEQLLNVYDTIITKNKYIYLSTPITTGKRFIIWYNKAGKFLNKDSEDYKREYYDNVIRLNISAANKYAQKLAIKTRQVIINPAKLINPYFSQADFILYWSEFIKRFIKTVIFVPHWEYSTGSISEYLVALNHNIVTLDINRKPILPARALMLLKYAKEYLDAKHLDSSLQSKMIEILQ